LALSRAIFRVRSSRLEQVLGFVNLTGKGNFLARSMISEQIYLVSGMLGNSSAKITWEVYNRFMRNLTHEDGSAFAAAMSGVGESSRID
jgi:hypothetical protein